MAQASPYQRSDLPDGSGLFVMDADEYGDADALSSITQSAVTSEETPTPSSTDGTGGGPITRFANRFSKLNIGMLRRIGMSGHEIVDAVRTRRDELYRNRFPVLKPRFEAKCPECVSEFDRSETDLEECPVCGHDELREPDIAEKKRAERMLESMNREGQSLRQLAKYAEVDQWIGPGVSTLVIRYNYEVDYQATVDTDAQVAYSKEPEEVQYADPASVKPVVDEDGRPGQHWYVCPVHRDEHRDDPGHCPECGAALEDVYFVEERGRKDYRYFLRDEVVTWSYPFPRLNGLDGLPPIAAVWLRQAILQFMDRYASAYFDQNSDSLPRQFMILHTPNPDHWEEQLEKIRQEDGDIHDSPILTNQYSSNDDTTPEVQVIDAMPDELLGQSDQLRKTYKEDIRQAFGISNVHDSDLEDAGGLNNEGLQLEVTDRSIASQQRDYIAGWLDELAKRIGIEDWRIEFLPSTGPDAEDLLQELEAAKLAHESGLDPSFEDGQAVVPDGDIEPREPAEPEGEAPMDAPDGGGAFQADAPETPDDAGIDPQAAYDAATSMSESFRDIVWGEHEHKSEHESGDVNGDVNVNANVESKASPTWSDSGDVPEQVKQYVTQAARGARLNIGDEAPSEPAYREFYVRKLRQPQGWSLDSLQRGLVNEFDFESDTAKTYARSDMAAILNRAKQQAYRDLEQAADTEVLYYWDGPQDGSTSDGCSELKEATNPDYGGTPLPWTEFESKLDAISSEHFDSLERRGTMLHPHERHSLEAVLPAELDDDSLDSADGAPYATRRPGARGAVGDD